MTESLQEKEIVSPNSDESNEPKSVEFGFYKKTRDDMQKYKKEAKMHQEELERLKLQLSEKEQVEMEAKEEFKKLYEKERETKVAIEANYKNKLAQLQNGLKIAAVRSVLQFSKPEYERFVDLNQVELGEDGAPTRESLEKLAEDFKQNYADLLKTKDTKPPLPATTSGNKRTVTDAQAIASLSHAEKAALLAQQIKLNMSKK